MSTRRKQRGRILVVEDEAYVRDSLREILVECGYEVTEAGTVDEAVARLARTSVDVILTDFRLPGADGLALVRRVKAGSVETPIVVLTGQGTIASAVECLKSGASDYLLKPVDPEALEVALDRAVEGQALKREVRYLRGAMAETKPALGESAAWKRTLAMVDAAAATDSPVLLRGESGTGKELLARRLHYSSPRASSPYVRVNCATVPVDMWESEFFGHRKGAFTGATSDRDGLFVLAHRGTLFLDEIGATPHPTQAKLLRALQDGEMHRLGDEQPTRVDVRVVAATNADLEAEIKEGRFRADLYYRLNVLQIQVPPLRERPDDIPLLAAAITEELSARLGHPAPALSAETVDRLRAYAWPGNVRELRSVIERALVLHPGHGLDALDLGLEAGASAPTDLATPAGDLNLRLTLNRHERDLVMEALRRSHGLRREAARLLGIDPRNLGYYFRKHGLDPEAAGD
ncbi:MAG TPA: sigma-54 dependent transcriptional regulator [Vicinamibacteria bacterium]|nr:sigma-54 dependent transcriptional regulator [Vicinamibacteria bacterium]